MKKIVLIFLVYGFALNANASKELDSTYFKEARLFVDHVYGAKFNSKRLVLLDEPKFGCSDNLENISILRDEELNEIRMQIKYPKISSWNDFIKPKTKYITKDSVYNIFNKEYLRLYNGWNYFRRYVGAELITMSSPIFFRDYQYCLFYQDYICGFKCGFGELKLFKRENNIWIEVESVCSWVS